MINDYENYTFNYSLLAVLPVLVFRTGRETGAASPRIFGKQANHCRSDNRHFPLQPTALHRRHGGFQPSPLGRLFRQRSEERGRSGTLGLQLDAQHRRHCHPHCPGRHCG